MLRRRNAFISAVVMILAISMISPAVLAAKAKSTGKAPTTKTTQKVGTKQKAKTAGNLQSMLAKLNLTAAQKTKIKAIEKDAKTQVKTVKADKALSAADQKTKIKAIHKATRDKIMQVLTAAQKTKLKKLMKQANKPAGKAGKNK